MSEIWESVLAGMAETVLGGRVTWTTATHSAIKCIAALLPCVCMST